MLPSHSLFQIWQKAPKAYHGCFLALDPGETTGYCIFDTRQGHIELIAQGQLKTWPIENAVNNLTPILMGIQHVVFESYQVYKWKTDEHTNSQVPTVQVIGCIKTLCTQRSLPYTTQTAQIAKTFSPDQRLKDWDLYIAGQRHACDAIRHAIYFLLFGPKKDS